ncbi:hypothetical protein BJX70DRAFT_354363 [Aspergillus crustosus]
MSRSVLVSRDGLATRGFLLGSAPGLSVLFCFVHQYLPCVLGPAGALWLKRLLSC